MVLPSFLVIGAMKSGTTTLYQDLRSQSSIYIPGKETSGLQANEVSTKAGAIAYERMFARYPGLDKIVGEVATTYAMSPNFADVSGSAAALMGGNLKVIYIVREPISRIISHHRHDLASGAISASIDESVRNDSRFLDYTRYYSQVSPWILALGVDSVKVICFEQYMADRRGSLADLLSFLGNIEIEDGHDYKTTHNSGDGKAIAKGPWQPIVHSRLYREHIRPLIAESVRGRIAKTVLPKSSVAPSTPSSETLNLIVRELRHEVVELGRVTGEGEWWDLEKAKRDHEIDDA